jgi:TetR/AcrR family transcriptional regulator of autoinduction and epiphytic fitness
MAHPTTDLPEKRSGTGVGTSAAGEVPERQDGRQLRRQRNREAVVDALLDLYADGNLRPSTEEIAARSGLSPRSLFRYFEDVDDLTRTAISRIEGRAVSLVPIDAEPRSELAVKVTALVEQRFRLFGAVGNAAAVSRLRSPFQPMLAERLTTNRSFLRHQIEALFAPELVHIGRVDRSSRTQALGAADVMCSFEAYQLLLGDQGLSVAQAQATMGACLVALFRPDR